ncbi:DNA (cytosine-5-)-methyltransferase [Peptostreptococcus faecalis]|uniref:DNA (cytosine-5-)-methyltransferase n=1 Tax=Peptostreptococcus faecalis TaxID=2045015 RepID=UPI000C7BBD9A|nr:DNA (cytosine-5-)-methyltransferase [Peptostreptococcus faecalis]
MRIIELFGGIGAFTKALNRLEIEHEVLDYVEIDKYAVASYNALNGTSFEPQDITQWDKNFDNVDVIIHGSPCQDYSIAGSNKGGDKGSGTRSSLMHESVRIIEKIRPKVVVWENVKNVISKRHKHNFDNYIESLENLGYTSNYEVLSATDYGIPQSRERIFVISFLGEEKYQFPKKKPLELTLYDLLDEEVDEKFYLTQEQVDKILYSTYSSNRARMSTEVVGTLCARDYKGPKCVADFRYDEGLRVRKNNICPTLVTKNQLTKSVSSGPLYIKNATKKGYQVANVGDSVNLAYPDSKTRRGRVGEQKSQTLTTQPSIGVVDSKTHIRKLTPCEYWKLMGFDVEDFKKAEKVNSNSQLYKQAGNSIVVNVLEEIIKEIPESMLNIVYKCEKIAV